jgi:hypothetical protein
MDRQQILDELQTRLEPTQRVTERMHAKYLDRVPRILCADGFTMSVQADEFTYCTPRNSVGPWVSVEIGFPSERVEKLMKWAENADTPTETVYGWVPLEVVAEVVEDHGGFKEEVMSFLNARE